jgi:hypothetical protein
MFYGGDPCLQRVDNALCTDRMRCSLLAHLKNISTTRGMYTNATFETSKIAACISSMLSCAQPTRLPGVRTPPVAMLKTVCQSKQKMNSLGAHLDQVHAIFQLGTRCLAGFVWRVYSNGNLCVRLHTELNNGDE